MTMSSAAGDQDGFEEHRIALEGGAKALNRARLVAGERDALARFAAARSFAAEHALPRYVFPRSSRQEKPVYVDLHSPPLVDLLAKCVRDIRDDEGGWGSLSEMLPAPGECWLHDQDGNRYTSELRLTVVDTRPWKEEAVPWPAS